jgi:putative hemolysin
MNTTGKSMRKLTTNIHCKENSIMQFKPFFRILIALLAASLALAGCAGTNNASQTEASPTSPETGIGLPNPASVFCQEQGGQLEIRTDASGGQYGVCIFADGSECDEWAFYRGECPSPSAGESQAETKPEETSREGNPTKPVVAWVGHIASTPAGSQYDDFISLMPAGAGEVGISGATPEIKAQIVALRDGSGVEEFPMVWGSLTCDVPDYGGCQLLVNELRFGQFLAEPTSVDGWQGSVACSHFNSSPSNLCGNAFVLEGDFPVWYGLWSADPELLAQIETLRDTGKTIKVWGQLLAGVPDINGTQIQVDRIEIAG